MYLKRHPKECKFKKDCRFQTRCSYSHKEQKFYINKSDEIKTLSEEIDYLKFEITTLKSENDIKIKTLVKVQLSELEELRAMNNILQERLNIDRESFNLTLISKDEETKDLNKRVESLTKEKETLERDNKIIFIKKNILKDRLINLEDQSPLCLSARGHHVYQCAYCEFGSGYKDKITSHLMEKHKKVHNSSKPIIEEEIYGEHCSCRKIFYDEEDLEKHKQEANIKCSMCSKCMTEDSPDLRYCYTMEHFGEGPQFDNILFKFSSELS